MPISASASAFASSASEQPDSLRGQPMSNNLLMQYYEAIEQASSDMLEAARQGDWDRVMRLEGACALLIAQLKHTAMQTRMAREEVRAKSRIMQRILLNDAEIRHLAEPWMEDLDHMLAGKSRNLIH